MPVIKKHMKIRILKLHSAVLTDVSFLFKGGGGRGLRSLIKILN